MSIAWLCVLVAAGGSVLGNGLLKRVAVGGFEPSTIVVLAACGIIFVTGTGLYALALASLPMAAAYPVLIGLSTIGTAAVGRVRYRERLMAGQMIGVGLIVAGSALLAGAAA